MIGRTRIFCAVALLGLVVSIGGAASFLLSKRMTVAADRFFLAVEKGDLPAARGFLAESLRTEAEKNWLPNLLEQSDLADAAETHWTERTSQNGHGELRGTVKRRGGEEFPVTLLFTRERLDWKLYAIRRELVGSLPGLLTPPRPDKAEQVALVKRAMQDFAVSVRSRNMNYFHSTLAPSRREQCTTESLAHVFSPYYDIPEDLTSLQAIEPQVEAPTDAPETGAFVLKGYFPSGPKQVRFVQKYCYEQTDWRLLSFVIDMR